VTVLKSLFAFVLGLALCATTLSSRADQCSVYAGVDGSGSEAFQTMTLADGNGYSCVRAAVPDQSDIFIDVIGPANVSYFTINDTSGNFADFRFAPPSGASWSYNDVPGGDFTVQFVLSGPANTSFTWVMGVYPPVVAIPEPSTYALILAGLAAIAFVVKRRREQSDLRVAHI
jgi:hypothetical protein